jgi:aromatic-amino-acid transaminase
MEFLIPSRVSRPGDDPIFALNSAARARAAAGEAIVNATVGALLDDEGRLAVLGGVTQALREVPAEVGAAYAPLAGNPEFLRLVVADLLGGRPDAANAAAVATPGGTGALRLAIENFLERGQTLLTSSFYWGPYKTLADESERALMTFRMFDARGRLDVDDFGRTLRAILDQQGRALVFLNSPCHNPTGYSFDEAEWAALAETVEREAPRGPISLVFDVAYARYGATDLGPFVDRVLRLSGKAMLAFAWSASKSFTQYGLRVGALVAVSPDADECRRVQNALTFSCRGTWSNVNAAGMAAIARILGDADLRARVDRERAALKALLDRRVARWNELAGAARIRYPRYDGGFFTTVFCDDAFPAALRLQEEGLFVVPQEGALRIALCSVAERDVPRLVDGIARATR